MKATASTQQRAISIADINWELLDYLAAIGADEFTVRFMYAGEDGKAACDRLVQRLKFASVGERTRECTGTYASERNPRPVEVWRLDAQALERLRQIMPQGIIGSSAPKNAWAEDLSVYRRGDLVFGTVTHEAIAFLRVTDAEWRQWQEQAGRGERTTTPG